jgi:hypothetical protein
MEDNVDRNMSSKTHSPISQNVLQKCSPMQKFGINFLMAIRYMCARSPKKVYQEKRRNFDATKLRQSLLKRA